MTPEQFQEQSLWISRMSLWVAIANALIVCGSVAVLWKQLKNGHSWKRFERAHDLIRELNIGRVLQLRQCLERKIDPYDPKQSFATKVDDLSKSDIMRLDAILNYFENMCLAIQNEVATESVLYEGASGILAAYWRWAEPHVLEYRRKLGPEIWRFIDPQVEKWKQKDDENRNHVDAVKRAADHEAERKAREAEQQTRNTDKIS